MPIKYAPISDLEAGTRIEACYLLHNFQLRPKKDGTHFATMVLRDATGKINCIMWENFELLATGAIQENNFIEVTGEVLLYNGQLQMKASRVRKIRDDEVDGSKFLPLSPVPATRLEKDLADLIARIEDPDLKQLVEAIHANPEFAERFRRAPSAVSMHQAYLAGLWEHTICVVRNALAIAANYPRANKSMLIAAGLLHDIGKTMEFVYDKKIAYSDVGRLLGHISMGNCMVELACSRIPNFPTAKKVLLQHIILSHHGLLEYGSPRRPKTLEAMILHHADLIDAQLSNYLECSANAQKSGMKWEYSNMFERYIMLDTSGDIEGSSLLYPMISDEGPTPRTVDDAPAEPVPVDDLLSQFKE